MHAYKQLVSLIVVVFCASVMVSPTLAKPIKARVVPAKTSAPKTVVDYFLLLPNKYFEIPDTNRKKWLNESKGTAPYSAVVDLKNDYLKFPGDGDQSTLIVSLFRYHGQVTVAVHSEGEEMVSIDFLRYERGHWTNVTSQVLPMINTRYDYSLPRYGTKIKVRLATWDAKIAQPIPDAGKRVYDLIWSGGKFHVKR